jgi:hypothetical protein
MTPSGLRAQYLIPNLSPKCECLSIHSSLPLGPRHHAILRNQRKQSLCRTEANCRPQVPLPNPFEETFLLWMGFLPNWAHKSDSLLYQILVLTVPSSTKLLMWGSRPPLNMGMANRLVLYFAEAVHLYHKLRKSSRDFKPNHAMSAKHHTTLSKCDCIGTLRGLYKESSHVY